MSVKGEFDDFLDEKEYKKTKEKLHDLMVKKLEEKIESGKNDVLSTLNDAWEGEDFDAYAKLVNATVQKCYDALDKLGVEMDEFIDAQINAWRDKEKSRIDQINEMK